MVHRVLTAFTAIVLFSALIAFTPHSAQALGPIPGDGNYTFTGGLTGSFHSDGTQLTTWDFTYNPSIPDPLDPLTTWKNTEIGNTQFLFSNDEFQFQSFDVGFNFIFIDWDTLKFATPFTTVDGENVSFPFSIAQASVPEPSSALLLLVSLVLFVGYRWRQQHPTEV